MILILLHLVCSFHYVTFSSFTSLRYKRLSYCIPLYSGSLLLASFHYALLHYITLRFTFHFLAHLLLSNSLRFTTFIGTPVSMLHSVTLSSDLKVLLLFVTPM